MNTHKKIIVISAFILILSISLIAISNMKGYFDINVGNILIIVVIVMWLTSFPFSFYTCYRIISEDTKKGLIFAHFIYAIHGGIFGGVFFVPFIIGPFFTMDYIRYIKLDYKRDKLEQ